MPASQIHLTNAKQDKLFYLVANVFVYKDGKCLILKRHEREKAHPGKYAVAGGKLEWNDLPVDNPTRINGDILDYQKAIEKLLYRETLEEAGVEIDTSQMKYIGNVAFIRPDGIPCVLVQFAAPYKSGEIKLEADAFTAYAWVNAEEVKQFDCIDGIPQEVAMAIRLFKG